ncbi:MAG: lipid-A-disaccharide synthase, partial [Candidatus Omnitrophica bacterium]|nr:lipid-A-disaccharide synthase [Candidatus Omnitrophota bacterium]
AEEILRINPDTTISGLGGPAMKDKGVDIFYDLTQIAVVGFVEVLKHYTLFKRIMDDFVQKAAQEKPDAVILVDYPGFNLILAKKLKALGIKVIYYISPQVWAWKEKRVTKIKQTVDLMLVIFQFEKNFYQRHGIDAEFVGHPLTDSIVVTQNRIEFLKNLGLAVDKFTVALLPGSREKEIERHLPVMCAAMNVLHKDFSKVQVLIVKAPSISEETITNYSNTLNVPFKIVDKNAYNAINAADFCIVSSGTATLETALLQKPMVIIYKTSFLTWLIAKTFVKISDIGLVNVVAGKRIVPECVQFQATGINIAAEAKNILTDETKIAAIKNELKILKNSLGESGASQKAAQAINSFLKSTSN